MKTLNISIILFIFLITLRPKFLAQNQISLSLASPMQHPGMDKFYNDNWLLVGVNKRNSYKSGINIDYFFKVKNDFYIGLKSGLGYRKNNEYIYDSIYSPALFSGNEINHVASILIDDYRLNYSQLTFNINPIALWQKNMGNFSIGYGIGPSFAIYGTGNNYYSKRFTSFEGGYLSDGTPDPNHLNPDILIDDYSHIYNTKISKGFCFGIDIFLKTEYEFNKKIALFAMINGFYHYMTFQGETTTVYSYKSIYQPTEVLNQSVKEDFRQLTFSNLLPSVGLTYKW